jgi:hypothetical protein
MRDLILFLAIGGLAFSAQAKEITPCKVRAIWSSDRGGVTFEAYEKTPYTELLQCSGYAQSLLGKTIQVPDYNWGGMKTLTLYKSVLRFNDGQYNLVGRITKQDESKNSGCELKLRSYTDSGFSVFDRWFKVEAQSLNECVAIAKTYLKKRFEYPTTTFVVYKVKIKYDLGGTFMHGRVRENVFFNSEADLEDFE